jgi:hypothetical protein
MGEVDCKALTRHLIQALKMLAEPAAAQIRYLVEERVDADELALQLDAGLVPVIDNCAVPDPAYATLMALDAELDYMSGQDNAHLWTDEALETSPRWATVRHLASDALAQLGPEPLAARRSEALALQGIERRVYAVILRRTIESDHGWGKAPAPFHGLFVLDRAFPGVGGSDFPADIENRGVGSRFSPGLRLWLAWTLRDLGPIEFVPGLLELVDLKSSLPVQVRSNRGFVALGPITDTASGVSVGTYFYAGSRWARSNHYELSDQDGRWEVTKFENLAVS